MEVIREIYDGEGNVIGTETYQANVAILQANVEQARSEAYIAEADPLFFRYQRGEIEKQVWLDKVQEIKDRFPNVQ